MDGNGICHFLLFHSGRLVLAVKAKPLRGALPRSLDRYGRAETLLNTPNSWDDEEGSLSVGSEVS